MADIIWVGSVIAGFLCLSAGILARLRSKSIASSFYLLAMASFFSGAPFVPVGPIDGASHALIELATKIFIGAFLSADVFLWSVTLVFPVERKVEFMPMNRYGAAVVIWFVMAVLLAAIPQPVDFLANGEVKLTSLSTQILIVNSNIMIILATAFLVRSLHTASPEGRTSGKIYLFGLWGLHMSGVAFTTDFYRGIALGSNISELKAVVLISGVAGLGLIFGYAILTGKLVIASPSEERMMSSAKSHYRLLRKRVYLVEEPKPDFAFAMFSDVLKGRCFDCEDDGSFACESLTCTACGLPCPCRTCAKYKSRSQGLIVTRQFPDAVRKSHFIQTTPILWLSTVPTSEAMDPAKLSLLTDYLANFMESSQNGVVLIDGLEYIVTSNDFQKALRAVDRWTEVAMTSNTRVIITVDRNAFDQKEMAFLERDREVVRPDAKESWKIIPERI